GRCIQIALDRQDGWKIPNPYAFDQILDVSPLDEPAGEAKFGRVIERIKELIKGRDIDVEVDRLPYLADRQPQIWRICESVARRMNEPANAGGEAPPAQPVRRQGCATVDSSYGIFLGFLASRHADLLTRPQAPKARSRTRGNVGGWAATHAKPGAAI